MLPPGPRTPVLWQTFRFVTQPKSYARKIHARYGDVTSFHSLIGPGIAVFEASVAREVFAAPPDTFEVVDTIGSLFGSRAVIATSGALHKKQRKLLNPPFHGPRIKALLGTMQRVVRAHLDDRFGSASRSPRATLPMTTVTQPMTLDVILETVFGSATSRADLERGRATLVAIVEGFSPVLVTDKRFHSPLLPAWRRYDGARTKFDAWVSELIADRRNRGELGDDLLGLFLTTRYEDGEPMSDREIRDHLITLLLAGHETSAVAIAWAIYFLQREPAVLRKLRSEIVALGPEPSPESLVRLPYLGAVVSESLRLEPIVTDVVRRCRVSFKLREWTVPAGQNVAIMVGAILGDPRVFPEPDRFRPERFLERNFHAGEFLPFGGGQRRCLGAAFAEAELAIALATIVSEWELELADRKPERAVRRNITMGPERGVRVRVTSRAKPRAGLS